MTSMTLTADQFPCTDLDAIPDQQSVATELARAREKLARLARECEAIDAEIEALEPERHQHRLLGEACTALEALEASGGAALFWEDTAHAEQIRRVRLRLENFDKRVTEVEGRREAAFERLRAQADEAGFLEEDLFEAQDAEEQRLLEWEIEREVNTVPHASSLPWTRGGEDDRRFRRALTMALVITLLFVVVAPLIEIPVVPEEALAPDVPERVVKLLEQRRRPPPPVAQEQPKPKPPEQVVKREPVPPKPVEIDPAVPEKAPEAPKGLLAFREKLAAIEQNPTVPQLGSRANINDAGGAPGRPQRAMLTTQAPGSSGGINLAALSRGLGGNGGQGMAGVQVARATSAIEGIGTPGGDRPLAGAKVGNSRTDEEIQIVFDRYKAALYRLYNRELRKDSTLRGQMVLRLTIEPDGGVSFCELHQTDMDAADLAAQVVDRVRSINFGAKEGISAITILYPIDFLPAA